MALIGTVETRIVKGRVERADSGKILGHLVKEGRAWRVSVSKFAFLGDGPFSGEPLGDFVPPHLYRPDGSTSYLSEAFRTSSEAIDALVRYLATKHAPAVGYGAHPEVRKAS